MKRTIVKLVENSNHIVSYAIDFNIRHNGESYLSVDLCQANFDDLPLAVKGFLNSIRMDDELRWGGDFSIEDPIHIDCPLNYTSRTLWEKNAKGCEKEYSLASPRWLFWK